MDDSSVVFVTMIIWVVVTAVCTAVAVERPRRVPAAIMFCVVSVVFGMMAASFMGQEKDTWNTVSIVGWVGVAAAFLAWTVYLFRPARKPATTTAGSAAPNFVPKARTPVRPAWGRPRFASRTPASRYAGYRRGAPRGG